MTRSDLVERVGGMPGYWYVRPVMGLNIRLRYVARRVELQRDDKTGEVTEAWQYESAVDAEDLVERVARRNKALGLRP
jgi:hypothetical protein